MSENFNSEYIVLPKNGIDVGYVSMYGSVGSAYFSVVVLTKDSPPDEEDIVHLIDVPQFEMVEMLKTFSTKHNKYKICKVKPLIKNCYGVNVYEFQLKDVF